MFLPKELLENNLAWTLNTQPTQYGQWLAWQITVDHAINPADRVEPVKIVQSDTNFPGKVFINNKSQALKKARKDHAGQGIWAKRSKLGDDRCGAAICQKNQTKHTLW